MTLVGTAKNIAYAFLFIIGLSLLPVLMTSISTLYNKYIEPRAQVAVIPIKGVLYDSATLVKHLHTYFKDPAIKAVLLKMECPGSAAATGEIIFHEIVALKAQYPKPVIVLVENVCASGGYYIATSADHIIASPMSLIGSVGVTFSYFFQLKDFIEQYKIKAVPLAAGDYKNTTNPFTELTAPQKQMLQELLNDDYEQFVSDVAQKRNLSVTTAPQWANGKIFTGRQALKLGLIDELGSWSNAIAAIKEKAMIETDIKWVHPPTKSGIWSFMGTDSDDNDNTIFARMMHEFCTVIESRYGNHLVG